MESRVRTISRGYVTVTEVMPARAPQHSRRPGERGAPGVGSKIFHVTSTLPKSCPLAEVQLTKGKFIRTYQRLVEVVASELHGGVGHYSYAVCSIAGQHTFHPLFAPDLLQRLPYARLILRPPTRLDLQKDL